MTPEQRVSHARRWTWRGAFRLRAGDDVAAGYALLARTIAGSLAQLIGPAATATFLVLLAAETVSANADEDRRAA
jgi:hypothetical protein